MTEQLNEQLISKVINEPVDGSVPMSYYVHFTAERVMLFFGVVPKSHRDALESLIYEQTNGSWVSSPEVAAMVGAKMAIGLPALIDKLKFRLDNELSENTAK